jgi:hypothetical protein
MTALLTDALREALQLSVTSAREWNRALVAIRRALPGRRDLVAQARDQRARQMRIARHRKAALLDSAALDATGN